MDSTTLRTMQSWTVKTVLAAVRAAGCTVSHVDGEYRVNFRNGAEATAYYTTDGADAVLTARAMMAPRGQQVQA